MKKKAKKRLQLFLINIVTSGRYTDKREFSTSDYLIRYVLLNCTVIFGFFVLLLFAVIDIRNETYADAAVCIVMSLVCVVSFALGRSKTPHVVPALITFICYGLMCVVLVWFGNAQGANFLFIYMFPSLTIMLLGMVYGVTASAILITIVSLEMFIPGLSNFNYHFDVSIRMLVGYILVFFTTIVVETTRKTKDRLIEIQKKRLQELKEEAETANRTKSSFLATMSHEIRTPMNAIIGIAQIHLQKENLPDEYASALQKINNSGNNLLGIINDILDMSKIETGKLELNPTEYDIPSLINDAVQLNIVRIGSKPLEFTLDVDENLPSRLYGDELRLKQILNNLLSNAIKYTERGSVKLSVNHSMEGEGEDLRLRFIVRDTGQGMKPEDQERLFSEYSRFNVEANRATEGTGLGLNITKRLVEMMDGAIEAESEYGKGSKFTVTVKQKAVECPVIGAELAQRLSNFTFTGDRQAAKLQITRELMPYGSVLVVDDVDTNLYVAEGLLSPYKLKIETADSGFAALEKIKNGNTYDIIFMDHMMPKMDGIETTEKLRELGYKGVIVALTANALAGNDEMFARHGFDGFISKPIDVRHLNAVLNKFVRNRHPDEAKKHRPPPTAPQAESTAPPAAQVETTAVDPKLIRIFCRDAEKAVVTLRETSPRGDGAGGDLKLFTTTAHAMKSALANVGENEISASAYELEKAGQAGDAEFIAAHTESFIEALEALIKDLAPAETTRLRYDGADGTDLPEDTAYLTEQLQIIRAACEDYDATAAYAALDRLKEKQWKPETAAAFEEIRDMLFLHSDFDGVVEKIEALVGTP